MGKPARVVSYMLLLLIGLCTVFGMVYGLAGDGDEEYSDLFVRENVHIDREQTVGKLITAGGNAMISGKVTDGIIVIDGSLSLEPGAIIDGEVIVLGGSMAIKPGAIVEKRPLVVTRPEYSFAPVIIGILFLLSALSLITIPVFFGIIGHLLKKTYWYSKLTSLFQAVQRRWPVLYIFVSLAISALMLAVFTTLAWQTLFRRSVDLFDNLLIWIIRYFANTGLDTIMIGISTLGSGVSYIILLAAAFIVLRHYRCWPEFVVLTVCLSGGAVLNFLLKHLFQRARPEMFRVVQESGYSFPSGHSMASVYFYGMAAFLIMRIIPAWRWRLAMAVLAAFLIVAIGISRIYLGVHYPSDVVAGYAAGSMWLAFCISLLMLWERRVNNKKK